MRLPIVPMIITATLLTAAWYFLTRTHTGRRAIDIPRLTRLADIDGIETEVSIAPDGVQYAVVVSGDLWLLNTATGARNQITRTSEAETFPAWTPDGQRITFTRGLDTFAIDAVTGSEQLFRKNAT